MKISWKFVAVAAACITAVPLSVFGITGSSTSAFPANTALSSANLRALWDAMLHQERIAGYAQVMNANNTAVADTRPFKRRVYSANKNNTLEVSIPHGLGANLAADRRVLNCVVAVSAVPGEDQNSQNFGQTADGDWAVRWCFIEGNNIEVRFVDAVGAHPFKVTLDYLCASNPCETTP